MHCMPAQVCGPSGFMSKSLHAGEDSTPLMLACARGDYQSRMVDIEVVREYVHHNHSSVCLEVCVCGVYDAGLRKGGLPESHDRY